MEHAVPGDVRGGPGQILDLGSLSHVAIWNIRRRAAFLQAVSCNHDRSYFRIVLEEIRRGDFDGA